MSHKRHFNITVTSFVVRRAAVRFYLSHRFVQGTCDKIIGVLEIELLGYMR